MLGNLTVKDFVETVASDAPVPGGGSVSALVGGIGAALLEMVSNLTIGRKKYAEYEEEMIKLRIELMEIRAELLELMEKDSESYEAVMKCFSMPKSSDEEKAERSASIQQCLYEAALTPLEVAETCLRALERVTEVLAMGNVNAYSDAKVAALMLRGAVHGACYNVQINVESLKDQEKAAELSEKITLLRQQADALETEALAVQV